MKISSPTKVTMTSMTAASGSRSQPRRTHCVPNCIQSEVDDLALWMREFRDKGREREDQRQPHRSDGECGGEALLLTLQHRTEPGGQHRQRGNEPEIAEDPRLVDRGLRHPFISVISLTSEVRV